MHGIEPNPGPRHVWRMLVQQQIENTFTIENTEPIYKPRGSEIAARVSLSIGQNIDEGPSYLREHALEKDIQKKSRKRTMLGVTAYCKAKKTLSELETRANRTTKQAEPTLISTTEGTTTNTTPTNTRATGPTTKNAKRE